MEKTKVKILNKTTSNWFKDHIGEIFEVYTLKESNYFVKNLYGRSFNNAYVVCDKTNLFICKDNCIDILEQREKKLKRILK